MNNKLTKQALLPIIFGIYFACVVISNVFEMKTIGTETFAIVGGGILLSWLTFLITDIVTEVWGKQMCISMFSMAAALNVLIMCLAKLLIVLPGTYTSQNEAFRLIFDSGIRVNTSSIIAFWLGNYINTNVMMSMKKEGDNNISFFVRAVISTLLGQMVDNLIFVTLAFYPIGLNAFEMTMKDICTSVLVGTTLETAIEMLFVPILTIPISNKLKQLDN